MSTDNNNNDSEQQQSMGALFQQRRAAASNNSNNNTKQQQQRESYSPPRREYSPPRREYSPTRNNNNNSSRHSRGSRGGSRSRNRTPPPGRGMDHLPLEQGVVRTMKDSFGFIYCADRPDEVFFHFSQVVDGAMNVEIDDEVEFRVGTSRNDPNKLAAYQVARIPKGSIVWESEKEVGKRYRGLVERAARGNANMEGTIKLVKEDEVDNETEEPVCPSVRKEVVPDGPLLRFTINDIIDENNINGNTGNGNGNGNNHQQSPRPSPSRLSRGDLVEFSMWTQRRTKNQFARDVKLILSERERSHLEKEKKLLETAQVEQGVITALKGEYGFLKSNRRTEEVYFHYSNVVLPDGEGGHDDHLAEGQDMEFLVVTEEEDGGMKRRVSARSLELRPRGSVVFHETVVAGVTGVLTIRPSAEGQLGTIRLCNPIKDKEDDVLVTTVSMDFKDSPGGEFSYRGGAAVGIWIREGDKLLFDVIKEFADGSYRAAPTRHLVPNQNPEDKKEQESAADDDDDDSGGVVPAVRLISLALAGRAEGVIHAIKDSYGFIHFAERPVDVHFKLFEMIPDDLQMDIRRNMGLADVDASNKPLQLGLGAEVQFDMSVHGFVTSPNHRNRRGHPQHERENLKAQRVLLLPPSTIFQDKVIATGVTGVVTKEDTQQIYSGAIDLDEELKHMTFDERHPLVATMIDDYLKESELDKTRSLVFHDVLSLKEDEVIMEMASLKGAGLLTCVYIPVPQDSAHPGRLCITRNDYAEEEHVDDEEHEVEDYEHCHPDNALTPKKSRHKKKPASKKPIKTVRFNKPNLVPELQQDMPPGVGDKIICDVVENRRSGKVSLEHIRMTERMTIAPEEGGAGETTSGVGVVREVVQARGFGFISILDETSTKREAIFFQFASLVGMNGKDGKPHIRKGDEVVFDVAIENGKRVAVNVRSSTKRTVPSKAEKNACTGYVLMEPSHTKLSEMPLKHSNSTGSHGSDKSGGRWEVKSDSGKPSIRDEGFILLLEDPSDMFAHKENTSKKGGTGNSHDSRGEASGGLVSAVCTHLPYKNGAIAIHGAGASSALDDSSNPRRGDLVSFAKAKSSGAVRDVRVVTRSAANRVRGHLENIVRPGGDGNEGTAKFIADDTETGYDVSLSEVVSCDPAILKDKVSMEGILHNGGIFGLCRTADIYLESKLGGSHKHRPRLNLSVRKDRAGKIIAQSSMAKGPDGSNGFHVGWTTRTSKYTQVNKDSEGGSGVSEAK